jgi:dolichol-phosphate mannosyltransferase
VKLSIVVPCYNEENTLAQCIQRVLYIADHALCLEVIIVDDGSTDGSLSIARQLATHHPEVVVLTHAKNRGKGAALRTGFQRATGDFVTVQDADLEYNPAELRRLLVPLLQDEADVVLGSRFLTTEAHRVLYFWHSVGNSLLTLLSNMFTDLNLTDMETCYKVFKREIIQSIDIRENRFGFEPEIVAKIAHKRLRIFEMGISYAGRTYEEGKKIGVRDGLRALYCIVRYNAHTVPVPIQFLIYLLIGGLAALVNLGIFLRMLALGCTITVSALVAFIIAAVVNYLLCIYFLFRHTARWNAPIEAVVYTAVIGAIALVDLGFTRLFMVLRWSPTAAKLTATAIGLVLNYAGRRVVVFPEAPLGPWRPQSKPSQGKGCDLPNGKEVAEMHRRTRECP